MSLFKQFQTDPDLEKNGIIISYGPNRDLPAVDGKHPDMCFRVARAGGANAAYSKRVDMLAKKHRRAIQNETIDPATLQDISKQAFIDTILLGWENVTDENGALLEFNRANAAALLEKLPDLYSDLVEQSSKAANFRYSIREDDAKN